MIRKKIKKILVPLDCSKNSMRGLDEGIYLARQCQATITGLYVIPIYPRNLADAIMPFQIHLTKEAKKFMEAAKTRCAQKGIVFKSKVIFGTILISSTLIRYSFRTKIRKLRVDYYN